MSAEQSFDALANVFCGPAPQRWTAELVKDRLVEARAIESRMPGQGIRRVPSTWPAQPIHDWQDMLHWDDHRQRVWESWEHAPGAWSWEVSRMDEALAWLLLLRDADERIALDAWALCRGSRRFRLRKILKKRNMSRTTFYRHVKAAATRLADILNRTGVQVRS